SSVCHKVTIFEFQPAVPARGPAFPCSRFGLVGLPWRPIMQDLIAPHGGLAEPVDRTVPAVEVAGFSKQAANLKKVPVSDADLSSLYRFGDGGLSPLTGPMDQAAYDRVLDEEVILNSGKKYAWTIPISFPVDKALAASSKVGETVALVNSKNELV